MLSLRRVVPVLLVLLLLAIVGCGGRYNPRPADETIVATAGGLTASTSGSVGTGSTASSAGSTSGDVGSTGGAYFGGLPLADAVIDVAIASASGTPSYASMAGTGDALGFAMHTYSYDERTGAGYFATYASVGEADGTHGQTLWLDFDHDAFVAVGTQATIDGVSGGAFYSEWGGDQSGSYSATGGTATVTALGPGLSVTLRLTNVVFHSEDPTLPDLTFNGTIRSSALPQDVSSTSGETSAGGSTAAGDTTGGSGGYTGLTSGA